MDDYRHEEESKPRFLPRASNNKVVQMRRSMEVSLIKPTSMEDTREICDYLLAGKAVVLNMEGIHMEVAQRIIDFTCGATDVYKRQRLSMWSVPECWRQFFCLDVPPRARPAGCGSAGFRLSLIHISRYDIIQAITFGKPEGVIAFCQGIQAAAPVDSYVSPEPWDMPGYDSQVIMAAGAFIQGSSIELSADGPIKPPYSVFFQGGLTWYHAKLGILMSLQKLLDAGIVKPEQLKIDYK